MAAMQTYVALLYSIVLAPGRRVVMSDLKTIATELGFENPRTVLATGNLIFRTKKTPVATLEKQLEAAFKYVFGRHVDIIIRTADDWAKLVAENPFPEQSRDHPSHVIVRVMRDPVTQDAIDLLAGYATKEEEIRPADNNLWIYFGNDIGHSRLAAAITPKRAGIGTSRNWNTVQKIAAELKKVVN